MIVVPSTLLAQISYERKLQSKTFPKTNTCGLTKFALATFDGGFKDLGGSESESRFRMSSALWETSDPSCIKNYGVVQYIKGCIYNINHDPKTGEKEEYFGLNRDSRGQTIDFVHKNWEVDSIDIDPLYSSYDQADANDENRFNWNKVTKKPFSLNGTASGLKNAEAVFFNSKNYDYVMNVKDTKQIFVVDIPSGSDYDRKGALGIEWITRSSLEFKTCLYNTKDIPKTGDPKDFTVSESEGGPIVCFEWSDKTKVDFENKTFTRTEEMAPFCLQ